MADTRCSRRRISTWKALTALAIDLDRQASTRNASGVIVLRTSTTSTLLVVTADTWERMNGAAAKNPEEERSTGTSSTRPELVRHAGTWITREEADSISKDGP